MRASTTSGPCAGIDFGEEANERSDKARRRLARLLAGLKAEGVEIVWQGVLRVEDATCFLKVRENGPIRTLTLFLSEPAMTQDPDGLLTDAQKLIEHADERPGDIQPGTSYNFPRRSRRDVWFY